MTPFVNNGKTAKIGMLYDARCTDTIRPTFVSCLIPNNNNLRCLSAATDAKSTLLIRRLLHT